MKKELIIELFEKFEGACYLANNLECWSARELQEILVSLGVITYTTFHAFNLKFSCFFESIYRTGV
jgi:hypothetical protein